MQDLWKTLVEMGCEIYVPVSTSEREDVACYTFQAKPGGVHLAPHIWSGRGFSCPRRELAWLLCVTTFCTQLVIHNYMHTSMNCTACDYKLREFTSKSSKQVLFTHML